MSHVGATRCGLVACVSCGNEKTVGLDHLISLLQPCDSMIHFWPNGLSANYKARTLLLI